MKPVAFWIVLCFGAYYVPLLLTAPLVELLVFAVLICVSQAIYRRGLARHFATADLA